MKRLIAALVGLGLVLSVVVGNAWGVQYTVTDLGDLEGGENVSHPMAVNNAGQVVGVSGATGGDRAFLWQNGVMTNLDVLTAGDGYSFAWDINDVGQIVGTSGVDGTGGSTLTLRAFVYANGSMTVLPGFDGVYGEARGINNAGDVVGNSHRGHGAFLLRANGTMVDLGSLGGVPDYSDAYAVNNSVQVVGGVNYTGNSDTDRGVLWENSTMTDLGDLPSGLQATRAYDINNLGQVVGESAVASATVGHAFLWQNGVMSDLGVLADGSDSSWAFGINDSGLVVGTSYSAAASRAFLWDSVNGIQDLNGMLDSSGAGWTLQGGRDISNTGYIVGWGITPAGFQHGFLLAPVPEPSTLVLLGIGAISLLAYAWQRRGSHGRL